VVVKDPGRAILIDQSQDQSHMGRSMAREAPTFRGWAECNLYAATAKNRKPAIASLSGVTLTGSLTVSDSANK